MTARSAAPFIPSIRKKNRAILYGFPRNNSAHPANLRYVVVVDVRKDRRVAYATLWELRPRRYRFDLAVVLEWQRQGIGTQLLDRVIADAHALGATGLQARVRDDKPEAFEFVARRGFQESHRMGAYRLDFAQTDVSRFQDSFARLRERGLEVTTLAAVRGQDRYLEQFYELYSAAREGWPDPDPAGPAAAPLAQVKRSLDEAPPPDAFFSRDSRLSPIRSLSWSFPSILTRLLNTT